TPWHQAPSSCQAHKKCQQQKESWQLSTMSERWVNSLAWFDYFPLKIKQTPNVRPGKCAPPRRRKFPLLIAAHPYWHQLPLKNHQNGPISAGADEDPRLQSPPNGTLGVLWHGVPA